MKKNFALRVDAEVFDAIEQWAADEFRSANGQIEWILSEALKKAKRHPKTGTAVKKVLLWLVCSLGLTAQAQWWTGLGSMTGLLFSLRLSDDAAALYAPMQSCEPPEVSFWSVRGDTFWVSGSSQDRPDEARQPLDRPLPPGHFSSSPRRITTTVEVPLAGCVRQPRLAGRCGAKPCPHPETLFILGGSAE